MKRAQNEMKYCSMRFEIRLNYWLDFGYCNINARLNKQNYGIVYRNHIRTIHKCIDNRYDILFHSC